MDPQRIKDVYEQLESLEDRLGYRMRARNSPSRATVDQVEDRLRDVISYASELRELVRDLILALAAKPPAQG